MVFSLSQKLADSIFRRLKQYLPQLENSTERSLLEKGMRAMQRRSGAMPTAMDDFRVTSLEVIIHEHKKLGEGGFGQVFRAVWLGTAVAVKVMERGVPLAVRSQA